MQGAIVVVLGDVIRDILRHSLGLPSAKREVLTGNLKECARDDNGEDSSAEREAAGIHSTTNLTPTAGEKYLHQALTRLLKTRASGNSFWQKPLNVFDSLSLTRAPLGPLPRLSESLFSASNVPI